MKLRAQINRDYEKFFYSFFKGPPPKKDYKQQRKTGRKPGGQPGHKEAQPKETGTYATGNPSSTARRSL
ncbi:MAG: hypothetical protein ACLU8S_07325 [Coprococcus phoceensis]